MTKDLFREDSYLKSCEATITEINELNGIILDQTVFYPTGGGQPGDTGILKTVDGKEVKISTTVKSKENNDIIHVPAEGQDLPSIGTKVIAEINWETRYKYMRMHSAMHLMCSVVPCGVTGGQVGAEKSRLDFDIGEHTLDKEEITKAMNALIEADHETGTMHITTDELDANPDLVRTMSVQPPRIGGQIRLVKVGEDVDLQPCGGTHIKRTSEIGRILVSKIENKGKRNRRVNIVFDPA
ncbi:alanyl-tRNA editing protein [Curvivirga aplysinae]|uniref:alanyl-tRNA editing protein n=1 Tax=Curvivirga aplysinae TaxID=2529852 RepID=UPI0012BD62D9|nr:alanyl-tRNA editing protein [Curvivirga aplysinae]MTI09815.1 alanyl-tRNA editing protein [Curvivirga aplysinae]